MCQDPLGGIHALSLQFSQQSREDNKAVVPCFTEEVRGQDVP